MKHTPLRGFPTTWTNQAYRSSFEDEGAKFAILQKVDVELNEAEEEKKRFRKVEEMPKETGVEKKSNKRPQLSERRSKDR